MYNHHQVGRLFLHRYTQGSDRLRKLRVRDGDTILYQDLGDI